VEPGHCFGQVCHYIHLNPVRAGVVRAERAAEYPWRSLPKFPQRKRPEWLEAATVLEQAGGLPDTKGGWRKYQEYLEFLASDKVAARELAAKKMSRGWCLGGKEFRAEVRKEVREKEAALDQVRFEGLEKEALRAERESYWEGRLQEAANLAKIDLKELPRLKSAKEKCVLASVMKHSTSVSNRWLAKRLGMGQPASASQFSRRWMSDARRAKEVYRMIKKL